MCYSFHVPWLWALRLRHQMVEEMRKQVNGIITNLTCDCAVRCSGDQVDGTDISNVAKNMEKWSQQLETGVLKDSQATLDGTHVQCHLHFVSQLLAECCWVPKEKWLIESLPANTILTTKDVEPGQQMTMVQLSSNLYLFAHGFSQWCTKYFLKNNSDCIVHPVTMQ